jgi:hypothetical protein
VNDVVPRSATNCSACSNVSCAPRPTTVISSPCCRANCSTPGASARHAGQCGAQNHTIVGNAAGTTSRSATVSPDCTSRTSTSGTSTTAPADPGVTSLLPHADAMTNAVDAANDAVIDRRRLDMSTGTRCGRECFPSRRSGSSLQFSLPTAQDPAQHQREGGMHRRREGAPVQTGAGLEAEVHHERDLARAAALDRPRTAHEDAAHVLARTRRTVRHAGSPVLEALLREFADLDRAEVTTTHQLVLPLELLTAIGTISLFSTITTFGSPRDTTLEELVIETFYPADPDSGRRLIELTGG